MAESRGYASDISVSRIFYDPARQVVSRDVGADLSALLPPGQKRFGGSKSDAVLGHGGTAVQVANYWLKVDRFSGPVHPVLGRCWVWTGTHDPAGYSCCTFGRPSRMTKAHRVAVILDGRTIPADLEIDHLCRNVGCVNPAHLEVVTQLINLSRRAPKACSACRVGGHYRKTCPSQTQEVSQ